LDSTDIFIKRLDRFVHFVKPSADDPVLLIADGHNSHTKNLDVVDKAREPSVAIVNLPPNSKQKMKPLEFGLMKPLEFGLMKPPETYWGRAVA
jgi:riboflavin biosynthesis pyrimidine reductase